MRHNRRKDDPGYGTGDNEVLQDAIDRAVSPPKELSAKMRVLDAVALYNGLGVQDVARVSGVPAAAVPAIIDQLKKEGLIEPAHWIPTSAGYEALIVNEL